MVSYVCEYVTCIRAANTTAHISQKYTQEAARYINNSLCVSERAEIDNFLHKAHIFINMLDVCLNILSAGYY